MSLLETGQLNILLTSDIFLYKNAYSLACLKNQVEYLKHHVTER